MGVYATTYCNFGHNVKTGRPVGHECRTIPPVALQAEMSGHYEWAIDLMRGSSTRAEYECFVESERRATRAAQIEDQIAICRARLDHAIAESNDCSTKYYGKALWQLAEALTGYRKEAAR